MGFSGRFFMVKNALKSRTINDRDLWGNRSGLEQPCCQSYCILRKDGAKMFLKIGVSPIAQIQTFAEVGCQCAGSFVVAAVTVFPGEKQVITAFLRIPEQGAGALIEG